MSTMTRPSNAGRPRGSGQSARLVSIRLAAVEAVPWRAGFRMAIKRQSSAAAWNGDIGELFHLLTDAEREAVWNVGAQWFATWVAIGMKSAEVEQSIKSIRG